MKETSKNIWIIQLIFIALILFVFPMNAHSDLKEMVATLHPYIGVQEEYNDNINLTERNRVDDFITTVYAGLTIPPLEATDLKKKNFGIDLDYRFGLAFYAKETDSNYIQHEGTLNTWYRMSPRWTFRLREYLLQSQEPREKYYDPEGTTGEFVLGTDRGGATYFRNVLDPMAVYQFGRENRILIHYRNILYETQSRIFEDSQENQGILGLDYWLNRKNGLAFTSSYSLGTFEKSADFTGQTAQGRYVYRFNPKTFGFFEYDYLRRDFDSSPPVDYEVHTGTFGVEHAFNPVLSGKVQLGYFLEDPKTGSNITGPFYEIFLKQRAKKTVYTLSFRGGYAEDYFSAENLGFAKYNIFLLSVVHQLKERTTVELWSSYERAKYVNGVIDQPWGIGGKIYYRVFKWIVLSVGVIHQENFSSVSTREYRVNRAIFSATAKY
jgi:hypothetical protein